MIVGQVIDCEVFETHKVVKVDIGSSTVTIVTNAPNIQQGSRTVVALVGEEVEIIGEPVTVESRNVYGVTSNGIICDSKMCGWTGGALGIAVQIPETIKVGDPCPLTKPRTDGKVEEKVVELSIKEKKELEKQARKAALKEKRAGKKELKEKV